MQASSAGISMHCFAAIYVCPHLSLSAPFVGTKSVVMAASSKVRDGQYFRWLNHDAEQQKVFFEAGRTTWPAAQRRRSCHVPPNALSDRRKQAHLHIRQEQEAWAP